MIMALIIIMLIVSVSLFSYIKYQNKQLTERIFKLEKQIPDPEDYKKGKDDIKTLYQNQQLLLSLVNAVRVRINNFYAKKLKEAKLKSAGFEPTKDFGEAEDSI